MKDAGSELRADGAAHRKECFAKSVRANGWISSGVAVERSVRALTRRLMRWLRYRGPRDTVVPSSPTKDSRTE